MTEEVVKEVMTRFDALAVKAGVGVDYFWPMLVKQQIWEGVAYTATVILSCILCLYCFRASGRSIRACEDDDLVDVTVAICWGAIALFIGIFTVTFVCSYFPQCVLHIFNPEFYALKEIMP